MQCFLKHQSNRTLINFFKTLKLILFTCLATGAFFIVDLLTSRNNLSPIMSSTIPGFLQLLILVQNTSILGIVKYPNWSTRFGKSWYEDSHLIMSWYFFFNKAHASWNLSFKMLYLILDSCFSNDQSFSSPLLHFWNYPQLHLTQTPFPLPSFVANRWRSCFPPPRCLRASRLPLWALSNVSAGTHSELEGWGCLDASCRHCECVGLEIWHAVTAPLSWQSPSLATWR